MADIADDPTPPTPVSATAAIVIHTVLQVIAATLSSLIAAGVFPDGSTGLKVAVIVVANLVALGYGTKTTAAAVKLAARAAVRRASTMLVLGLSVGAILGVTLDACAGVPKPLATFGSCSVSSLEADVGNGTVLDAVKKALLSADYAGAIEGLIAKIGEDEVACAVLAIDDMFAAPAGTVAHADSAGDVILRTHAADLIAKRGWRAAAARR
jgi:hypothetical protein